MGAVRDLAAAAEDSPHDVLTVQALADALEELGAGAASVRALTVDGTTVLLLGLPMDSPGVLWESLRAGAEELRRQVAETYGVSFGIWVVPAELTVRQIKISKGVR